MYVSFRLQGGGLGELFEGVEDGMLLILGEIELRSFWDWENRGSVLGAHRVVRPAGLAACGFGFGATSTFR